VLAHTEQQLGFALFERVKGRLVPTQEAKALLPEAEKVYQQLGQFRSLTNKVKQGTQHLRVGAPPVLAAHLLAPTVALLSKEHSISFELLTANRDELCS
ncbi:LysR family transcriptional regulator, partial [Escherichia coli]|nr:LysR family transcriptional regulator [Escherichia coli]